MSRWIGWIFVIICAISALLAIIFSFTEADARLPGSIRLGVMHFLIPVIIGWLALFPRSREELDDLRRGHPLAQRFFGGRPGGFFGDYRRRLTRPGKLILYGSIGLTALLMLLGAVRIELAIIGIFYLVALCYWVMRLEKSGDRLAGLLRRIGTALVYEQPSKTRS